MSLAILTIFLTLAVIIGILRYFYIKYEDSSINLWFIHPLFIFDLMVLLTFFIPYFFQLFFGTVKSGLDLFTSLNIKNTEILCISIIFVNLFIFIIDRLGIRERCTKKIKISIHVEDLYLIITLSVLVLFFHIYSFFKGGYYFSALANIHPSKVSLKVLSLINFFLIPVKRFVWIALSILYFTKFSKNKKYKILFWSLIFVNMILAFPSGSKSLILTPLIIFVFCYSFFERNKLKLLRRGVIFFLIMSLFFPLYNVWRNWYCRRKIGNFEKSYIEFFLSNKLLKKKSKTFLIINSFIQRLDNFSAFFIISKYYPKNFPLLNGESFQIILFAPVPRIIFPSKPKMLNLNEIGRKVGLLHSEDYVTSPGLGWWGEGYINFGYWGVFFVILFMGLLYEGLFLFLLKHASNININIMVINSYLFFLSMIIFEFHSNVSGVLGGFVKFIILMLCFGAIFYAPSKKLKSLQI